jgi:hypothetical protein
MLNVLEALKFPGLTEHLVQRSGNTLPNCVIMPYNYSFSVPKEPQRYFRIVKDVLVGMGTIDENEVHGVIERRKIKSCGVADQLRDS